MAHVKRNVFAGFGWVVWKLLALVGVPIAVRKVKERAAARGDAHEASSSEA
jgi:hypothetical protein